MFQLTKDDIKELSRCKNFTLNKSGRGNNIKYMPHAFTEQGIYMLMTVLKGELAIKQSKALIKIFKKMKDYIINNKNLLSYNNIISLALQTTNNTEDIKQIKKELKNINTLLNNNYVKETLILNGEYIESDFAYKKIYDMAQKTIYIIDNYIDLKTLVLLKDIENNINITIFSDNVSKKLHNIELQDFKKEYPNVNLTFKKNNNKYHDRYIIIDFELETEKIYHCGASSKDSGNKITTISEVHDIMVYRNIINDIKNNEELKFS